MNQYILKHTQNPDLQFFIGKRSRILGKSAECDWTISLGNLSDKQARFWLDESSTVWMHSLNGICRVNGQDALKYQALKLDDLIQVGDQIFQLAESEENTWSLIASDSWMKGQHFDLHPGKQTLGRSAEADLTLPSKHLSRLHAEFNIENNTLTVTDLDSANGTFVNGQRVSRQPLHDGDVVKFDQFSFRVLGPEAQTMKTQIGVLHKPVASKPTVAKKDRPHAGAYVINTPRSPKVEWTMISGLLAISSCIGYLTYIALQL